MPHPKAANLSLVVPASRIVDREPERVGRWVEAHGGGFWRPGTTCVGRERHGELVAGVMYDWFNGASIFMSVAGLDRRWLSREYLWFCFYYPFVQLGAEVVIATVASDNVSSQKFCEHLGYTRRTTIPGAHPSGALHLYTMRKSECHWLDLKGARHVQG